MKGGLGENFLDKKFSPNGTHSESEAERAAAAVDAVLKLGAPPQTPLKGGFFC